MKITAERLREYLAYDPTTGIFTWKMKAGRNMPGSVAGTLRSDGYIRIQIEGERRYASHWAWLYMTGELPMDEVDHEDRNRANNRWLNLRPATKSQNCANRPKTVRESGLLRGVTRYGNRFKAQMRVRGRSIYLGLHDTEESAHAAYAAQARIEYGEFAMVSQSAATIAANDNEPQRSAA